MKVIGKIMDKIEVIIFAGVAIICALVIATCEDQKQKPDVVCMPQPDWEKLKSEILTTIEKEQNK